VHRIVPPPQKLSPVLLFLYGIADTYKSRYGRTPVLVFDNINLLARENPKLLYHLQEAAKYCADNDIMSFVFISSDGSGPRELRSHSEWSRIGTVIEIGEIDTESAKSFYESKGITPNVSVALVNLTGGRFVLMKRASLDIKVFSIEEIRNRLLNDVRSEFELLDIELSDKLSAKGCACWRTLELIYDTGTIPYVKFPKQLLPLLTFNIFAFHPRSDSVSLQSKPVWLYIQGFLGENGSVQREAFQKYLSDHCEV